MAPTAAAGARVATVPDASPVAKANWPALVDEANTVNVVAPVALLVFTAATLDTTPECGAIIHIELAASQDAKIEVTAISLYSLARALSIVINSLPELSLNTRFPDDQTDLTFVTGIHSSIKKGHPKERP
jgi:hypothetical protein